MPCSSGSLALPLLYKHEENLLNQLLKVGPLSWKRTLLPTLGPLASIPLYEAGQVLAKTGKKETDNRISRVQNVKWESEIQGKDNYLSPKSSAKRVSRSQMWLKARVAQDKIDKQSNAVLLKYRKGLKPEQQYTRGSCRQRLEL